MAEWSKAHAWKVCMRQKRIMGSNPILSAIFFSPFRFYNEGQKCNNKTMDWDRNLFSKIMTGFGFVMVAIFLGIGIALMFFPVFYLPDKNMRLIFGFFFIAYGLFRLARIYQQIKKQKKEFNNE